MATENDKRHALGMLSRRLLLRAVDHEVNIVKDKGGKPAMPECQDGQVKD